MSTPAGQSTTFPAPLNSLPEGDIAVLERYTMPVEFPAGTCIFKVGSVGDACYMIDEGVVRIDLDRSEFDTQLEIDSDTTLGYVREGGILGELSLLDRLPRSASAYAQTDVRSRRIDAHAVDELLQTHPRVAAALYAALGRDATMKLRETNERLASVAFAEAPDPVVGQMVARALAAQRQVADWSEERIDALLASMDEDMAGHAEELAAAKVAESGMGDVQSKIMKIRAFSLGACAVLTGRPARGVLERDGTGAVTEIASPVGVVLGLGPLTNPISTYIFKALICVKSRNALIFSPNRRARRATERADDLVKEALLQHGAPPELVQCVRGRTSRRQASQFMSHRDVSLILATAGPSVVRDAYSSGTPTIGTNSGNTPVLICSDVDVPEVVAQILKSKTFDNGVVCAGEHNLVVVESARQAFVEEAERQGAAVLTPEEVRRLTDRIVDRLSRHLSADIVGQSADKIARGAGIERDYPIRLIVVPTEAAVPENPYAHGKLAPLLSLFTVRDEEEGFELCLDLLDVEGRGHTAAIHTRDDATIRRFGERMPASRILANSPCSQGILGLTNGLPLSMTLGCGTEGRTSTTDNVTYTNLLNIKRLAPHQPDTSDYWDALMSGGSQER